MVERRFSTDEAEKIFIRAAELSAREPAAVLSATDLERIAEETGLEPAHVRRAITELDAHKGTLRYPGLMGGLYGGIGGGAGFGFGGPAFAAVLVLSGSFLLAALSMVACVAAALGGAHLLYRWIVNRRVARSLDLIFRPPPRSPPVYPRRA